MSNAATTRVRYFEKQFLRVQDFTDEQDYHLAMRRRHNIAHHVWGIVRGLQLESDGEGNVFVLPGMAIDGYGRELVLEEKLAVALGAFAEKGSDVLDVWLEYDRVGAEPAPRGYVGCGRERTAESFRYRWQESPLLRLTVPDPAATDRRRPETVPEGDLAFGPDRVPFDDPQQDWPVFLGTVERSRSKPEEPYSYTVDLADRPYVGLVGEAVTAPSGRARVQIGAELAEDDRRFAVFVLDPEASPSQEQPDARLEIDKDGKVDIRGETTVHGDVTIDNGTLEFAVGQAVSTPQPWRIYRVLEAPQDPQGADLHQLRIEMASEGNGHNQVVIGAFSEESKEFVPCLTIADDCTVTVHGNLVIGGSLVEEQKRADAILSGEAKSFVIGSALSGIAGGNAMLPQFYQRQFPAESPVEAAVALAAAGSQSDIETFLNKVAETPESQNLFTTALNNVLATNPDLKNKLSQLLGQGGLG